MPIDSSVAIGFFRLVQLRARDPVEAEIRAVEAVKADWDASAYACTNRGGSPYLTIFRIGLLSWWQTLLGAPRGYIFFGEDGLQIPSDARRRDP